MAVWPHTPAPSASQIGVKTNTNNYSLICFSPSYVQLLKPNWLLQSFQMYLDHPQCNCKWWQSDHDTGSNHYVTKDQVINHRDQHHSSLLLHYSSLSYSSILIPTWCWSLWINTIVRPRKSCNCSDQHCYNKNHKAKIILSIKNINTNHKAEAVNS